ncbi:hypothetical protein H6F55_14685 [Phormidium sp. FACHB-322]|uniref:DUF1499 domain-containing protein n=1 Tax=unclassified Phormidium TaxID=2609805 RepID=UPI0016891575|nr:hypothetical protein [Phormidium sp. FACHB-77]MBD2031229.1 hypothetical protein [Phormidium sp. FACHB-322]MBD2049629.1 hypothetical protein [Leptolyngbya sp. FACHB-60]
MAGVTGRLSAVANGVHLRDWVRIEQDRLAQPSGALPGLSKVFVGEAPELGIQDGKLSPCPSTPNCVVSQGADPEHVIEPIALYL